MKKTIFTAILISTVVFGTSFAQIEISMPDTYWSTEMEIAFDVDVSGLNLDSTGGNQTWTFDQPLTATDGFIKKVPVDSTDWAAEYPEANWAMLYLQYIPEFVVFGFTIPDTLIDTYYYQSMGESWIQEHGMGFNHPLVFDTTSFKYPEPSQTFPNPLTKDAAAWDEVRQIDIKQLFLFAASIKDSSHIQVNGWGDLTLASGTYPCLQLKRNETRTVKVGTLADTTVSTVTYQWLTSDFRTALTITGWETDGGIFQEAIYLLRAKSEIPTPVVCDPACDPLSLIQKEFALTQNYPNPFNPVTEISYHLPERAEVELTVYTILGQEVAVLSQGFQEAGTHISMWNGKNAKGVNMPGGVYFYRLRMTSQNSATNILTRKMTLLK